MSLVRLTEARPSAPADAIDLMLRCHERIRRYSALAARLLVAEAPHVEVAEAARQVHRYFTVALPLHAADEERLLLPLLRTRALTAAEAEAAGALAAEHEVLDRLVEALAPGWLRIAEDPERRGTLAAALGEDTGRLSGLMAVHLSREEQHLFPAARRLLAADELDGLMAGIRERREHVDLAGL